jgi:hypothetical protein
VMTEYRSEPKGRRNFDTALHCNTVDMIATEKTRTAKPAVRATCFARRFTALIRHGCLSNSDHQNMEYKARCAAARSTEKGQTLESRSALRSGRRRLPGLGDGATLSAGSEPPREVEDQA